MFYYGDWIRKPGVAICSCNDGLRPVIFKLEATEQISEIDFHAGSLNGSFFLSQYPLKKPVQPYSNGALFCISSLCITSLFFTFQTFLQFASFYPLFQYAADSFFHIFLAGNTLRKPFPIVRA